MIIDVKLSFALFTYFEMIFPLNYTGDYAGEMSLFSNLNFIAFVVYLLKLRSEVKFALKPQDLAPRIDGGIPVVDGCSAVIALPKTPETYLDWKKDRKARVPCILLLILTLILPFYVISYVINSVLSAFRSLGAILFGASAIAIPDPTSENTATATCDIGAHMDEVYHFLAHLPNISTWNPHIAVIRDVVDPLSLSTSPIFSHDAVGNTYKAIHRGLVIKGIVGRVDWVTRKIDTRQRIAEWDFEYSMGLLHGRLAIEVSKSEIPTEGQTEGESEKLLAATLGAATSNLKFSLTLTGFLPKLMTLLVGRQKMKGCLSQIVTDHVMNVFFVFNQGYDISRRKNENIILIDTEGIMQG
eukprot:CAMPEP_0182498474 /NCGR_PEP_ID=MMETSP1321-20130603/6655_1 /TAXON_ID=91990 /ORGANISM="Bolidomonas sp., Strain RCC1657" /LENGTH=355 /DNA_ID=CAMNT_0024702533 /DNA_START=265 /DNA_END=1329 /DNA_ORIENTATION=-